MIILVILGTVSIYGIIGKNGIIRSSEAQQEQSNKELEEQQRRTNEIKEQYNQTMDNTGKELKKIWTKTISGNGENKITDVVETTDGGYVVVGYSTSTDTELFTNQGKADAFIVKYSADGEKLWSNSLGGAKEDWFSGVIEINNEYIVVGSTLSDTVKTKEGEASRGSGSAAGIIAKYDNSGNEVWAKIEQNNGTAWDIEEKEYEYILFTDIAKTETGYSITGKLDYNDSPYNTCELVLLEYANSNNTLQTYTKLWKSSNNSEVTSYNSYGVRQGTAGIIYESSKYTLFGNNDNNSRLQRIQKVDKKDKDIDITYSGSVGKAGRTYNITSNAFSIGNGKIVMNLHSYTQSNTTLQTGGICIYDETTKKETWIENGDYKAITKVGNSAFATLKNDGSITKLQKYATNGNLIAEYNVADYDNIYKIGVEEGYILTGNPTNETEVITKNAQDAIISKYKLVDKQ